MKRTLLRILLALAGLLVALFAGLTAYASLRWDRTFEVATPELSASTDPAVIERGAYLAYGPAHCAACHVPLELQARVDAGDRLPLAGGRVWELPIGTVRAPNLTPHESGIGKRTDGQLARMIRYGVRHDGRATLPFMEYQSLSDDDVVALISFLRAQPPVDNAVPEASLNLAGKAILALMIKPLPQGAPRKSSPAPGPTIDNGEYLAVAVANCKGCHTQRDPVTTLYAGPLYGGGTEMEGDDPSRVFVTPNLTTGKGGMLAQYPEDAFVARFRGGRVHKDSHMPWPQFGKMSDDDVRAVYRFLRTVPPVDLDHGPLLHEKK